MAFRVTQDWLLARCEVVKNGNHTPCWVWNGHVSVWGQPMANVKDGQTGKWASKLVRRLAWLLVHPASEEMPARYGAVAEPWCCEHCVRPEHIRGTTKTQRQQGKRRTLATRLNIALARRKGSPIPQEDVPGIVASSEDAKAVAARYGVRPATIYRIRERKMRGDYGSSVFGSMRL